MISDFTAAFQMLYKKVEDGFEGELTAKVTIISDERAQERYLQYPQHYRNRAGIGESLSQVQALIYIKNGVYLDVSTETSYAIRDPDSFLHGLITAPNEDYSLKF